MKKYLIIGLFCVLLSACAAPSTDTTASRQSSVEMYGVIDAGIGVQQITY